METNGKSLAFVKKCIADGQCYGDMEKNEYESMVEYSFDGYCKSVNEQYNGFYQDGKALLTLTGSTKAGKEINLTVNIAYDPDAEFQYFTMKRCTCDGTLLFMYELMNDVLHKVMGCQTVPKDITVEELLPKTTINYTVGDFVICTEYGEQFATEEKPWMTERLSVMLPIKVEIEGRNEEDIYVDDF